jgi:hypothetical protein
MFNCRQYIYLQTLQSRSFYMGDIKYKYCNYSKQSFQKYTLNLQQQRRLTILHYFLQSFDHFTRNICQPCFNNK